MVNMNSVEDSSKGSGCILPFQEHESYMTIPRLFKAAPKDTRFCKKIKFYDSTIVNLSQQSPPYRKVVNFKNPSWYVFICLLCVARCWPTVLFVSKILKLKRESAPHDVFQIPTSPFCSMGVKFQLLWKNDSLLHRFALVWHIKIT